MPGAVDMIHRHLECLKYLGGLREGPDHVAVPTGQGIDLSIVLLPDLLLDVRLEQGKPAPEKAFALGGRSARMACTLLHLLGEDDGTYQVHLLAKTAKVGRLLLENELDIRPAGTNFFFPFLESIVLRDGEPRCGIRFGPDQPVVSSPQTMETELTRKDLEEPGMLTIIRGATAICLTSLKTPDFGGILRLLLKTMGPNRGLFLDTRRGADYLRGDGGHGKGNNLLELLHEHSHTQRSRIAGMFVRHDEESDFLEALGAGSNDAACQLLGTPIIVYGNGAKVFLPGGKSNPLTARFKATVEQEGMAESFKAGTLLAWSVYATLTAHQHSHDLCASFLDEWPAGQDGYWERVLEYAAALAEAREEKRKKEKGGPCKLEDLLHYGGPGVTEDHLPKAGPYQAEGWFAAGPPRSHRRTLSIIPAATPKVLARLAGRRRVGTTGPGPVNPGASLACPQLPLCEQQLCDESYAGGCPLTGKAPPYAAVMIDLDGTLMDSAEERDRGLTAAFAELPDHFPPEAPKPIAERIALFTTLIYDCHELYNEPGLILGDFRQEWNHEGWYIAYLVFLRKPQLRQYPERWKRSDQGGRQRWQERFLAAYQQVKSAYREQIHRAINQFESVRMYPFKEARDFLRSLKMSGALNLYVVSEGHPDTQWRKLCSTGLSEFFSPEHLLTTGDAVESVTVRESLKITLARLDAEARGIRQIGRAHV